ncbi:MAG TPA: hypothetical protein ENI07_20905 [Desulfobacterales bacterium]|nr:hypothetical protein [Desulfobacterales bacterium]
MRKKGMKHTLRLLLFLLMINSLMIVIPLLAAAAEFKVKPVKNGGSISGTVSFKGQVPKPKILTIVKDQEVANAESREVDVVVVNDGHLAEAVVYLAKVKAGKEWPLVPENGMINQEGARFLPTSRVVHKGVRVEIKNSDPIMHNIHTYELIGRARRTLFNRGQIPNSAIKTAFKVKKAPFVKLECDKHDFMHEYLFVASNPYYSVTGKDGAFSITDIPPGTYTLSVWHPVIGKKKTKITVTAGQRVTNDFTFEK